MTTTTSSPEILTHLQQEYGLDEFQAPAANHLDGPALVLASAGSGKTTCLTARVIHLIHHYHVPADQILCITFTNKATQNMVTKIEKKLGKLDVMPFISTLHSLGLFIVRHHPYLAYKALCKLAGVETEHREGEELRLTLWDERECQVEFNKFIKTEFTSEKVSPELLDNIFFITNRGYTPKSYSDARRENEQKLIDTEKVFLTERNVELWRSFLALKARSRVMDFTDMILLATIILEDYPKVQARYFEKWRYILQDEAQDASPLQWKLLTDLTNPRSPNVFAVGDDSQSIMSFQGSEVALIQGFRKSFMGVPTDLYYLQNNYRSHPQIVALANAFEQDVVKLHPAPMITKSGIAGAAPSLSYIEYMDNAEEAGAMAEEILRLADVPLLARGSQRAVPVGRQPLRPFTKIATPVAKPFLLKDIAILVRTKMMIPSIENALIRRYIPYYVREGKSLLQTKEVMDLLAYLKLLTNPYDLHSFSRAVQVPRRQFGDEGVRKLAEEASTQGVNLFTVANRIPKLNLFMAVISKLMKDFKEEPKNFVKNIETWATQINYAAEMNKASKNDTDDEIRRVETLKRFKLLAQDILDDGLVADLPEFLDYISLMQDAGKSSSDDNRVHIMTAHSAKGLEYQVVFAPCFFEGGIPHVRSLEDPLEIAEEARLTYVIITRAIRQLRVSRPRVYISPGAKEPKQTQISQFLIPMLPFFREPSQRL